MRCDICLAMMAGFVLSGCGEHATTSKPIPPVSPAPVKNASPEGRGSLVVRGTVRFKGVAPQRKQIDVAGDKWVAEFYKDKAPLLTEDIVVGENGGLANVIVYFSKGHEKLTFNPPKDPLVIEEIGAHYVQHVAAAMVNQRVEVHDRDHTTHNPHWGTEHRHSTEYGGENRLQRFTDPELPVNLGCDVHKWMKAKVGVFDHPFFAVSNADGSFEISGLLPGKYTLTVWHEKLGTKSVEIEVKQDGGKVDFEFEKK